MPDPADAAAAWTVATTDPSDDDNVIVTLGVVLIVAGKAKP